MLAVVLAYLLDLLLGEPPRRLHPVVWMGAAINCLEGWLRRLLGLSSGVGALRLAGVVLVAAVVGGAFFAAGAVVQAARALHPALGLLVSVWIIFSTLARRTLAEAGLGIHGALQRGDLALARRRLGEVVGRDTADLPRHEVARGAVETVAENAVDGVVAPLFYAVVGGAALGPALALAYRAANTLDSMVGYRNERYLHFGWAAARLDDLLNFLPARLTGLCMLVAARLLRLDWRGAWRAWRRDAGRHPSPNAGIPEAAAAGALRVRLGGTNYYGGVASHRAHLGHGPPPDAQHIRQAVDLMALTGTVALSAALGLFALVAARAG